RGRSGTNGYGEEEIRKETDDKSARCEAASCLTATSCTAGCSRISRRRVGTGPIRRARSSCRASGEPRRLVFLGRLSQLSPEALHRAGRRQSVRIKQGPRSRSCGIDGGSDSIFRFSDDDGGFKPGALAIAGDDFPGSAPLVLPLLSVLLNL